ncbi:MAG: TonB-dependent receptor [Bryobacteraceae bacterium]|jgi:hypothetical protein
MKRDTNPTFALCALCCMCAGAPPAADIPGTVTASTKHVPVPGARVILHGANRELRTVTDEGGAFEFTGVDTGARASLEVSAAGFQPYARDIARIPAGSGRLDVQLDLAGVYESITVAGRIVSLESSAPGVSESVSGDELAELPTNTRNLTKAALYDPHVRQVVGLGGDGNNNSRLSINAGSYRHTSYVVDGIISYDWIYANGPYQPMATSATEELRVVTNQYSAQNGTSTTGTIKITTKTGSNDLHGEAFTLLKPSGIQAAPPLSPFRVPNEREQWGGLLGGPIAKNGTFFFGDYEGIRQERGSFIQSPQYSFFNGVTNEHYGLARFDHTLSDDHTVSLRLNGYHYSNTNANDRVGGYTQPSAGRLERTQSWGGQLADHLMLGGILNEFRANYASYFPDSAFPLTPSVGIVRPSYSTEGYSTTSWVHSQITDLSDMIAVHRGRHSLKAGVEGVRVTARDYSDTPFGTYTFAAGPPTPGQHPSSYSQTFGTANITYGETNLSAYAQDDVRLAPRLSANIGLRYEYQSSTNALHNLAPRAGLSWDVRGDGKTVVHAGGGIFYDQLYLYVARRFFLAGPGSPQVAESVAYGSPGFPTFPSSLTLPPAALTSIVRNLYLPASHLLNPYSLQFSLGVERQLGRGLVVTVDGIHNHTLRQYRVDDINHPAPFIRTGPGQFRSGAAADATRPMSTWDGLPVRDVGVIENSSSSLYDALDFGVRRRLGNRFQLEGHYVVSSSESTSMFYADFNSGIPNEWNNWGSAERAPSDFFQHHRFSGRGTVDAGMGFRLDLTAIVASGLPVNPLTGSDNNGDSYSSDRPVGFGRNSFRAPMQANFDASLHKTVRFGDKLRTEFRVDTFNLFNRNNPITLNNVYGEGPVPRATFLTPIAGVNNIDPSRQIQFGLRLLF